MKFKLFGCQIYISFFFWAVIAVMIIFDKTGLIVPTLLAVFFHETGHLLCMWAKGVPPQKIKLIPTSVQICAPSLSSFKKDIAVSLCGPLFNIIIFFTLYLNFLLYKNYEILIFALINLLIAIFNLLPLKGLDGGKILHSIISLKSSGEKADKVISVVTLIFSFFTVILAVFLSFHKIFNISLYIIALYLLIISLAKK